MASETGVRNIDVIALVAWIAGMGVNAALYFYTYNPVNAVGLVVTSGGLVFSSVTTICMAIKRASDQ